MAAEIKIGQRWLELDPRPEYQRTVEVVGLSPEKVQIRRVSKEGERFAPARWAKRERFNGLRGGYQLTQDVPPGVKELPAMPLMVAEQFAFFKQLATDHSLYADRLGRLLEWIEQRAPGVPASEYLAKVEADPRRAAALQRARERAAGVPIPDQAKKEEPWLRS